MKRLSFTLGIIFFLFIAATSRSRYSLVFCIKVALGLDLVHSKHRSRENSVMNKIPAFKSAQQKRHSLKMILSDLGCAENFQKTQRKNPIEFTSASKKEPLRRLFLVNFPNIFQKTLFYKSLTIFINLKKMIENYYIVTRSNAIKGHLHFIYNVTNGDFTE